jgi:hypothetical protein
MTTSDQKPPPRERRGKQIAGKILQFAAGQLLGWLLRQWWG